MYLFKQIPLQQSKLLNQQTKKTHHSWQIFGGPLYSKPFFVSAIGIIIIIIIIIIIGTSTYHINQYVSMTHTHTYIYTYTYSGYPCIIIARLTSTWSLPHPIKPWSLPKIPQHHMSCETKNTAWLYGSCLWGEVHPTWLVWDTEKLPMAEIRRLMAKILHHLGCKKPCK